MYMWSRTLGFWVVRWDVAPQNPCGANALLELYRTHMSHSVDYYWQPTYVCSSDSPKDMVALAKPSLKENVAHMRS